MAFENSPDVAIITVTYNAADFIHRFLQSVAVVLREKTDVHLILVDNASSDSTVATVSTLIEELDLQARITVVPQAENSGFGRGCNAGAAVAKELGANYYWFLNPDTTVEVPAVEALLNCFKANPAADVVGSALKDENRTKRSGAFRFPGVLTTFLGNAKLGIFDRALSAYTSTYPLPQQPITVDWLTGASFMIKAKVFDHLRGFDPKYFLYFEEVDLFLRAQRAGYQAWFCPGSVVFHESGASTGINKKGASELKPRPTYWFESRRYFYLKNHGRGYFLLVDAAFLVGQGISRFKSLLKRESANNPPQLVRSIIRHSGLN